MIERSASATVFSATNNTRVPRGASFLLFAFGFSQFFVRWEPGPAEILTLVMLPILTSRAILNPGILILLVSGVYALIVEIMLMGTMSWSMVSLLLVVQAAMVMSAYERFGRASFDLIILGGIAGAGITLALSVAPFDFDTYRYGIRFTGFFKDPNVTAPTALFFAVMALSLRSARKWLALIPFSIFLIALSRATILAFAAGLALYAAVRRPITLIFSLPTAVVLFTFSDSIFQIFDQLMDQIGRGGLINSYDVGRADNWAHLLNYSAQLGRPLGPGFSDANGFSTHSTYIRLSVEQGWPILLLFLITIAYGLISSKDRVAKLALVILLINGLVIDATHWRILFVALAFVLATSSGKDNRLQPTISNGFAMTKLRGSG